MLHSPRIVIRTIGELFITIGVLLILFLIYQLWWSSVTATRASENLRNDLMAQWDQDLSVRPTPLAQLPSTGPSPSVATSTQPPVDPDMAQAVVNKTVEGNAFALMYIPRLRNEVWGTPIVKGIGKSSLARGIGYYPDSAAPGTEGNFAVAGHRTTHGEPFRSIDRLRIGDEVIVRTKTTWFTYRLERDDLVRPRDTWVVDPVPRGLKRGELITLITCHPRWASTYRWIWWGVLVDSSPADQPPAAVS